MDALRQDLRWAVQGMRTNPGLAIVVVLSLGLSIGAITAAFSVVNAFLLRPLPIDDIDRVVRLRESFSEPGERPDNRSVSAAVYYQWKEHNQVFEDIAASTLRDLNLTGMGDPVRLSGAAITANFFPVLGMEPILGRNFLPEEDRPGQGGVTILSYGLWVGRFGADPDILDTVLTLNGQPHTVIGVMERGLSHPYEAELWVPLRLENDPRNTWGHYTPARLKPGITLAQASAEMAALARRLAEEEPLPHSPKSAHLSPLRGELVGTLDTVLYFLFAAAGFVVLIACANVSNLLLVRSLNQSAETAVRVALGATRGRLVRQFLTYSLVLTLGGGVVGILLSAWSIQPLVALSPVYALGEFDIQPRMDLPTLGFSLLVAVVVGVVLGLVPALRVSRTSLHAFLQEGGRAHVMSTGGRRLLSALVVVEVAFTLMLLVAAALILQSFGNVRGEDRGFNMENLLTFEVAFSQTRYGDPNQRIAFLQEAFERIRTLPEVVSAGATTTQPLYTGTYAAGFNVEGRPATTPRGFHMIHSRIITPDYPETLQIPLVEGRLLTEHDDRGSELVVLVSDSVAERFWPDDSAIGKRVKPGPYDAPAPWFTIVGVVGTLHETEDATIGSSDAWYLSYKQIPNFTSMCVVIRTTSDPKALVPAVREVIRDIDAEQPIFDVMTMEERLDELATQGMLSAILYTVFGLLGLILAALGVHGIVSFRANQRLREIGIRAAMGAQPGHLKGLILRQAMILSAIGLVLGTAGGLLLMKGLAAQLYGIRPLEPATLAGAFLALALVALASSYFPASRAARTNPCDTLREG